MTPAGSGWRSWPRLPNALKAEICVTQFVSKLVLEANDLVLEHNLQTTADGIWRIHFDLRPVCRQRGSRTILTLRLARKTGPSVPPRYPALAVRHFQLI